MLRMMTRLHPEFYQDRCPGLQGLSVGSGTAFSISKTSSNVQVCVFPAGHVLGKFHWLDWIRTAVASIQFRTRPARITGHERSLELGVESVLLKGGDSGLATVKLKNRVERQP